MLKLYEIPVIIYTQTHQRDKGKKMAHSFSSGAKSAQMSQHERQTKEETSKEKTNTNIHLHCSIAIWHLDNV